MTKDNFICPYCTSSLTVDDRITLACKKENHQRGIIQISSTLGNYDIWHNENFQPTKGEKVELNCPVCQHNLEDANNPSLSKLIKVGANGEEHTVLFSNTVGEQCTLVKEAEKDTTYGEHAIRFQDPEWYAQK